MKYTLGNKQRPTQLQRKESAGFQYRQVLKLQRYLWSVIYFAPLSSDSFNLSYSQSTVQRKLCWILKYWILKHVTACVCIHVCRQDSAACAFCCFIMHDWTGKLIDVIAFSKLLQQIASSRKETQPLLLTKWGHCPSDPSHKTQYDVSIESSGIDTHLSVGRLNMPCDQKWTKHVINTVASLQIMYETVY
jgi:hypothetical protein